MNVRQVEQAVSGHAKGDLPDDPVDEKLVRKTMWLSVRPETEVLFRKVRLELDKERGERLEDDAVMEALCRTYLSGVRANDDGASHPRGCETASKQRAASGESGAPYRVAVTICSDCKRGWQHGGGAVEPMSPAAVERATCDAQWIGDLDSNDVERARQEISPALRRKVMHRDQERCQAPDCRCFTNLDVHHIVHVAHGGPNEMWNLITLCEAHHLAHHEGTLVIKIVDGVVVFGWEGRNAFTRATREVATRQALRERGFDREQTKEIMRRTVTHVGVNDLSEAQWLELALRCADRLA